MVQRQLKILLWTFCHILTQCSNSSFYYIRIHSSFILYILFKKTLNVSSKNITTMLGIVLFFSLGLSSNAILNCTQPNFTFTEDLINTCSGDNKLSTQVSFPYNNFFFFVTFPCCNPCPYPNQTIKFHSATAWEDQQCFEVNRDLTNIFSVSNSSYVFVNNMDGAYFLNTQYNTIETATPCNDEFETFEYSSLYSNTKCKQPITCNELTQFNNGTGCEPRSAVDPRTHRILTYGGPYADNTIIPKTNCSDKNMFTIPNNDLEKDHECVPYSSCDSQWSYILIPATPTTDRSCGLKTTCSQCEYYDSSAHDNRIDDYTGTVSQHCFPCVQGTYQNASSHFSTTCKKHEPHKVCNGGQHTYSRVPASEMSCYKPTENYCVTPEIPNGHEFIGKDTNGVPIIIKQKSFNTLDDGNQTKNKTGPCLSGQFADYFGGFTENYVCIKCGVCKSPQIKVADCGPYTNTVCGEAPKVEAMYAFGLAAYLCYVVGALTVYRLHFVSKTH